jgi:hypothetical protein
MEGETRDQCKDDAHTQLRLAKDRAEFEYRR